MTGGFDADIVVIGAGIVGLATAVSVQRRMPGATLLVVDKEDRPGAHQTGRNSGVVHSGLYYQPGSTKARLVMDGRRRLERYCVDRDLPYERCGKVVVATGVGQIGALDELVRRGLRNGVAVERVGPRRLHELEPHVRGEVALWVPDTAITDYVAVTDALAADVSAAGGALRFGAAVDRVSVLDRRGIELGLGDDRVRARWFVNCGGLQSDRLARTAGAVGSRGSLSIVPFRGEYHELVPTARHLVRNLVYPVPEPRWPFLGVHLTRMLDGSIHVGPNAVLAFGRESYDRGARRLGRSDVADVVDLARDRGLHRLAARYWRTGAEELLRSRSRGLLVREVQRLLPEVVAADLVPSGSGIRAQALSSDGTLVDDFALAHSPRGLHMVNAPSPAATASLGIGRLMADEVERMVMADRS